MRQPSKRYSTPIIAALAALALSACETPKVMPPSPAVRAELGTVAVKVSDAAAPADPDTPVKGAGAGAAAGAGQGASGVFAGFGGGGCMAGVLGCAVGIAVGIGLAPVGAVVGAVVGGSRARAAEEVDSADTAISRALDEMPPDSMLHDAVLAETSDIPRIRLVSKRGPESGAAAAEQTVSVLFIELTDFGLVSNGSIDPDIYTTIAVSAEITRTADGTKLYWRNWRYWGVPNGYFELGADNAALLRKQLREDFHTLAAQMVHDLFVATEPAEINADDPYRRPQYGTAVTVAGPPPEGKTSGWTGMWDENPEKSEGSRSEAAPWQPYQMP